MPLETPARIVSELASRGYNAEREAVTRIADTSDPSATLERALETLPDDALKLTTDHVDSVIEATEATGGSPNTEPNPGNETTGTPPNSHPSVSTGTGAATSTEPGGSVPPETGGSRDVDTSLRAIEVANDMTGQSTGTGEYSDFVSVFRDRYEKLASKLRGRVNHRPTDAIENMGGGSDAALIGMVSDIRSTASGHWLVELEDTNGTFPCLVMKDRPIADLVQQLLMDEVIAVEGTLADDAGILFVDSLYFPDVPRTHSPSTADRHVQAALISDVHVGSQEFMEDAWHRFTDWLHTSEAENVEYLLIAGDMVEASVSIQSRTRNWTSSTSTTSTARSRSTSRRSRATWRFG